MVDQGGGRAGPRCRGRRRGDRRWRRRIAPSSDCVGDLVELEQLAGTLAGVAGSTTSSSAASSTMTSSTTATTSVGGTTTTGRPGSPTTTAAPPAPYHQPGADDHSDDLHLFGEGHQPGAVPGQPPNISSAGVAVKLVVN
jgi:hypothetical protein